MCLGVNFEGFFFWSSVLNCDGYSEEEMVIQEKDEEMSVLFLSVYHKLN